MIEENADRITTSIAIWRSTKERLDKHKAPGQSYNGFICQLVDLWKRAVEEKSLAKAKQY